MLKKLVIVFLYFISNSTIAMNPGESKHEEGMLFDINCVVGLLKGYLLEGKRADSSGSRDLKPSDIIKKLDSAQIDQEIEGTLKYNSFSSYLGWYVTTEKLNTLDTIFEQECTAHNKSVAWNWVVNNIRDHFFKHEIEKKYQKDEMALN